MEASSFEDTLEQIDNHNVSLNQTANSIHFNYGQKDNEMSEINDILKAYISEKLMVSIDFSYETIQNNPIISKFQHQVIKPIPNVYFLPSTVLFFNQKSRTVADLQKIKGYLQSLQRKDYQLRFNRQIKELNLIIHNKLQLLFYNMRVNKTESSLHRDPKMLDCKYLIDKLFEYYQKFYAKLYFRETSILILYWAYQHDLLNTTISQQALKLIIICNFINFGYGVDNVVLVQANNQEKIKMNKKMNSYIKINSRGDTEIMQGLTQQFFNYTIIQKRGFYLVSKKKFMQIKDIVPVLFPILPLSNEQQRKITTAVSKAIKGPIEHPTETMSICKNISKIFRFLHNKFEKPMRLVIDFNVHSAYRSQFAETFELQVIHPVLNTIICKMKDGEIKQLKRQINYIHEKFMKNEQPLEIMTFLMQKTRK